ncbi:MAG: alanine--glyoxylate aminotransferase family protein [Armatimonadota bacterium]|nr:alanine--glyoxylate aminotransferase family protein [Armatimonadota bacterium]MDR7484700.1 alanine--glyoxylate aminotransferase family protein [Armatimonadota bacterium]MDR7531815.1 alanine--glyoxylate aminotransferase family protein [Armatimonadota bacterium]MDR7534840.1 alanine--glyoxylate aminotransferase family protein [Armatimonadota bacterium]
MQHYLLIPGPTPLPEEVLRAGARQMVNHRDAEFGRLLAETLEALRRVFLTRQPVIPFAASGTGGLEAALVNLCSPGDDVVGICAGVFGDRFAAIAEAFGLRVRRLEVPWGQAVDPDTVRAALRGTPRARALLVTHNETSTGVRQDLRAIAEAARGHDVLLVVDAVSSLGAVELRADAWGLDVVITGSQKALMAPPGLALISVSDRALAAMRTARLPRFYWSFERMLAELGEAEAYTPFTPAIATIYALHEGLRLVEAEGLEARWARHRRTARAVRAGVRALGLRVVPDEAVASETVTAVWLPQGVEAGALLGRLRVEHGVTLSGGQGQFRGKIVRFGHLGWVPDDAVLAGLAALETVLPQVGGPAGRGATAAAREVLAATPA